MKTNDTKLPLFKQCLKCAICKKGVGSYEKGLEKPYFLDWTDTDDAFCFDCFSIVAPFDAMDDKLKKTTISYLKKLSTYATLSL